MKKSTLLIGAAVVALGFASCKKEYTCECTATVAGIATTADTLLTDMSKDEAKTLCDSGDMEEMEVFGITMSNECELK